MLFGYNSLLNSKFLLNLHKRTVIKSKKGFQMVKNNMRVLLYIQLDFSFFPINFRMKRSLVLVYSRRKNSLCTQMVSRLAVNRTYKKTQK